MNTLILQKATELRSLPTKKQFQAWVDLALSGYKKNAELVIRIVDTKEITQLNRKYRCKNKPTNIISFPSELPEGIKNEFLGDIAICAPIVKQEAKSQGKTIASHFAHLTIHGVLHLIGHTHENDKSAIKMEAREIKYLKKLCIPDPYRDQ